MAGVGYLTCVALRQLSRDLAGSARTSTYHERKHPRDQAKTKADEQRLGLSFEKRVNAFFWSVWANCG